MSVDMSTFFNPTIQCIYPLQPVKGNYSRVHAAMNELKSLASSLKARQISHTGTGGGGYRGCVLEGFQESLAQFQRFSQNFRQVSCSYMYIISLNFCFF